MDRSDAIERIQKCLALGSSPNENEARTAILMARMLMAKYKITEAELHTPQDDVVELRTALTFTSRRNSYRGLLSAIIAENMCCISYGIHTYRSKTYTIMIRGHERDARACVSALQLADAAIETSTHGMMPEERHSYAIGFVAGLNQAFMDQTSDHKEWGLIMVTPQDVRDMTALTTTMGWSVTDKPILDKEAFLMGVDDGHNHLNMRLEESA